MLWKTPLMMLMFIALLLRCTITKVVSLSLSLFCLKRKNHFIRFHHEQMNWITWFSIRMCNVAWMGNIFLRFISFSISLTHQYPNIRINWNYLKFDDLLKLKIETLFFVSIFNQMHFNNAGNLNVSDFRPKWCDKMWIHHMNQQWIYFFSSSFDVAGIVHSPFKIKIK